MSLPKLLLLGTLALVLGNALSVAASREGVLVFSIPEGDNENHFFRQGRVAAHAVLSSGSTPRVLVAFPAGNTGVGLWFRGASERTALRLAPGTEPEGVEQGDGLRGVRLRLETSAPQLAVETVLLANVRALRDYIGAGRGAVPGELAASVADGERLVYRRTTVDGLRHNELRLAGLEGTVLAEEAGKKVWRAGASGHVALELVALTDETPLTPFAFDALFEAGAADRTLDRQVFAFLASEEKLNAGSWRFLTYFGRDTLISLQLLQPVLRPPVIEAALGSVLERLGPDGEVAHEEGIGEYAAQHNLRREPRPADLREPELDYKMIDGEFLLPLALERYLLDDPRGRSRAAAFLARRTSAGVPFAEAAARNLAYVVRQARPYAQAPGYRNLVALKPGLPVGNWRDSEQGLGGGRYAYDVNAVLVPAALAAVRRLADSGLFDKASTLAEEAGRSAEVWKDAGRLFEVTQGAEEARRAIAAYATELELNAKPALAAVAGPVRFHALSLDASGKPVPVMHSDEGFALFWGNPSDKALSDTAALLTRPFPAGLNTQVGMVVANAAFAAPALRRSFTPGDYHGAVVWSWQQALMAAGLERQLRRDDLSPATRTALLQAQSVLWERILRLKAQSAGELWSWRASRGEAVLVPFGQGKNHADESNAAQLWSTVYLSVQPPRP